MLKNLFALYPKLPGVIQTAGLNAFAIYLNRQRFGRRFKEFSVFLEQSESWSAQELEAYQEEMLRKLVQHAFDTVPFYNRMMKELKLLPQDIKTIGDLDKLPIIDKAVVRSQPKDFLSTAFSAKEIFCGGTSGTTGTSLEMFWDINMVNFNNAVDWRQKRWAGCYPNDRHALILGRVVVPITKTTPPFWRTNYIQNQLWLSAFHMSPQNMMHYVDAIVKYRPKFIEGYPSTLAFLAKFMNDREIQIKMSAAFTSSETLFPEQRSVIQQAFACEVFDFYGMAERVVFATECSEHIGKHLNSEYGITEVVENMQGSVGGAGKLVCTSLHNYAMPLIRYATNDFSKKLPFSCKCGRSHQLIDSITTKLEDYIIRPDGTMISPSVLTHPFKHQANVIESQIIQEKYDTVKVLVVKNDRFAFSDEVRLLSDLQERLGEDIGIGIDFVDEIPRTKSGKLRWVVSKVASRVPNEFGE